VESILCWDELSEGKRRPRGSAGEAADVPALVWRELAGQVAGLFGGVTLADLVTRAERLGVARASGAPQMYFI
jgi:hypothetical protein